jgi:hypothetical protein
MHGHGLGGVFLELGNGKPVGTQAAVGFLPKGRSEGQPACAIDNDSQRWGCERRGIHGANAEMIEIGASMLGDTNHVAGGAALGDIDEEPVAGFLWQKA